MGIDLHLLSSPNFIIKKLQLKALKNISSYLKGDVLDVGCGSMPYKRYIPYDKYTGSDDDFGIKPDVCASAEGIPFKNAIFDSVICTEVLEHLSEPGFCLDELRRVLRQGGHLYITVPQSWGLHYEPNDYWRFTKYGIRYLLEKNGFKIISINRVGGIFSMVSQEMIDALWTSLKDIFIFLGPQLAERLATGFLLPASVLGYMVSFFGDRIDKRYALGWAVVAVK